MNNKHNKTYVRLLIILLIIMFILCGCGEKPPVDYNPPVSSNTGNGQTELVDNLPENNGNSKPLDYSPCEGIHVKAEENAFWQDTVVNFKTIDDSTPNINEIEQHLYDDEGIAILSGFEVDAGLENDEFIPGQYDVEYDLGTTEIDPELYEFLKVYRVGDDGTYYELSTDLDGNILKFSSNQNSLIVTGVCLLALVATVGTAAGVEYYSRNYYFIKSGKEVLTHDGKNDFGTYRIEWISEDVDPKLKDKLAKLRSIEEEHIREAEEYRKETDIFNRTRSNLEVAKYLKKSIEADSEHKKIRDEIQLPEIIKYAAESIDNAFKYLYEEEKVRMPLHTVIFKNGKTEKDIYGYANNRSLSTSYIDIYLNKVINGNKEDYYNFLLTITHELLHICQNRYRLPVDVVTNMTRYDEMVAQCMEADAVAYYKRKDIIPENVEVPLTSTEYWGNLRLPINGEEDIYLGILGLGEKANSYLINCGYNLGSFLRYLFDKTGKRPTVHTIMKARSFIKKSDLSAALISVLDIDERAFDLYFRNWVMSHRSEIGPLACGYVLDNDSYALGPTIKTKKGEKYHVDFIHGHNYFLNLTCFETVNKENQIMILVPDKNLRDVFPSSNVGPGTEYKSITAGAYIDKLYLYANRIRNLPVLEIEGDMSDQDTSNNAGYTVYVLDKTPQVKLIMDEEKLTIKLPEPDNIVKDGVADGYFLKLKSDSGKKVEKELSKNDLNKDLTLKKTSLFGNDPNKDVTISVTLTEIFKDSEGKTIMGIESDPVKITMDGKEAIEEPKPEPEPDPQPGQLPQGPDDFSGNLPLSFDGFTDFSPSEGNDEVKIEATSPYPTGNSYSIEGDRITFFIADGDCSFDYKSGSDGGKAYYTRGAFEISGEILRNYDDYISGSIDTFPSQITGIYEEETYWTSPYFGTKTVINRKEETTLSKMDPSTSWFEIEKKDGVITKVRIDLMGHLYIHVIEKQDGETITDSTNEREFGVTIRLVS